MSSMYFFTVATESELDDLLAGKQAGESTVWEPESRYRIRPEMTGVLWVRHGKELVRPLLIVVPKGGLRRLCGRYAQLRSDLSPLTPWCHVIGGDHFGKVDSTKRVADLCGLEAAWTGLAIAEASLFSEKPLTDLRVPACLATQTFVIARAKALWYGVSVDEVLSKFDATYQLVRFGASNAQPFPGGRLRQSLTPIWTALTALSSSEQVTAPVQPVVRSLRALLDVRSQGLEDEASRFVEPLVDAVPEAEVLADLVDFTAERRLQLFDNFMNYLMNTEERKEPIRRASLPLIAGYLATVAAGGSPSLGLAEKLSARWPEVTAWSYVLGGLGEPVSWSSGFDGLGRLVARDMMRPFHLDEAPSCDFSLDEAQILLDVKLADPLVHLRIKQAKTVSVSLLPGVNILVPLRDTAVADSVKSRSRHYPPRNTAVARRTADTDFVDQLADAIVRRLERHPMFSQGAAKSSRGRSKKERRSQGDLLED